MRAKMSEGTKLDSRIYHKIDSKKAGKKRKQGTGKKCGQVNDKVERRRRLEDATNAVGDLPRRRELFPFLHWFRQAIERRKCGRRFGLLSTNRLHG